MTARGRWAVETRYAGGAWTPYSSPEGILSRSLSRSAALRLVTRLRKEDPTGPDGDLEYRAREAGGEGGAESRTTVQVLLRLAPESGAALDALAARRGLDRSATVAALVREARGRG